MSRHNRQQRKRARFRRECVARFEAALARAIAACNNFDRMWAEMDRAQPAPLDLREFTTERATG